VTPEGFASFVNDERNKWHEVVKAAGVTVNRPARRRAAGTAGLF
jgi:hypothetical protein